MKIYHFIISFAVAGHSIRFTN